jgi:hypothetical protein
MVPLSVRILLALALLLVGWQQTHAQVFQPTAEQMQILNQLPPEQRQ